MLNEDHKEIASGKKKDDEGYMAKVELDTMERAIKNLKKSIKSSDTQLPAWVQSKITRAADYIDTASEYLQSDEKLDENIKSNRIPGTKILTARETQIAPRTGARALSADAAAELGSKAQELRKKEASKVDIPKFKKEEKSLVDKIIEEHCGCEAPKCNNTPSGKMCPKHGMKDCSIKEEKDPKGPVQPYKSPKEIAKKHGVSLEAIQKQLEMGIKVEGEHTSDKTAARITALQHLDEVPNYYTKLKKVEKSKTVKEAVRLQSETGNIISVTLSWRGKYHVVRMFFPQLKYPSRNDVTDEINKIYPGARVISFISSEIPSNEPFIKVHGGNPAKMGPSKNYIKPMGEEVEIIESKKSEMPCNKPKAEAHGSGETGKSHVVKACENGKEKLIRFGQKGVKGSPKKEGESEEYANRRERFKSRHAKNIAKGKMSAAYWANKVKW